MGRIKKGQIATEFILFSGIALIAAIIFVAVSLNQAKTLYETKEFLLVEDIALKIQHEISIASNTEDGYSRDFELPENINGKYYNISNVNNTLTVWTNATPYATTYTTRILDINGYFEKGSNTIRKANGVIYVN